MLQALRVRDFRLLWSARLISSLGSWLLVIAVPAHVLLLTGSVMATGMTLAAEYLPPLILGPVAGVAVDRWDRRRVMVATDLFRAAAVALMLFSRTGATVWVIYVALVTESAGTVLFRPAAQAHTPVLVGTGPLLSSANSLNAVTDGTVRLVGGPLGALLLAIAGFDALVWVDAASYLVSAAAILATRPGPDAPGPRTAGRVLAELVDGLRSMRGQPLVLALLPVTTVFLLANASLSAILIPFGLRQLGGSAQLGFLLSALGVGFLLGAPLVRLLVDRGQAKHILAVSLATSAFGYFLLFHSSSLVTALAAALVIGLTGSIILVTPQTVVQRMLPNSVLGRVSAVFFTGEAVATLLGALLGPAVAQATTLAATGTIAAVATLATGLVCLRLPGRLK
jgi:predicted MFS family arabinose efflux permease